jgi:hypothetical protein
MFLRQAVQFLVQGLAQLTPAYLDRNVSLPSVLEILKGLGVRALPFCPRSCTQSDALGDAVEPTARRVPLGDRAGFANEDKKRSLEGIFRIMCVTEDAPADPENHGPMPLQDGLKGSLILFENKAFQELSVGPGAGGPRASELADVPQDSAWLSTPHVHLPGSA